MQRQPQHAQIGLKRPVGGHLPWKRYSEGSARIDTDEFFRNCEKTRSERYRDAFNLMLISSKDLFQSHVRSRTSGSADVTCLSCTKLQYQVLVEMPKE